MVRLDHKPSLLLPSQRAPSASASSSNHFSIEASQDVLSNLLGANWRLPTHENVPQITNTLQQNVPERYEGEWAHKVNQLVNVRSTSASRLRFLFGLAAYFVSNNTLGYTRTDAFLNWVIDQKSTGDLEQFLQIDTPTIHAFAIHILKSAVRIKDINLLTALLDRGVKFDSILEDVVLIGDINFTKLVFDRVNPAYYRGRNGFRLLRHLIGQNNFELAQILFDKGLSMNNFEGDILVGAASDGNIRAVRFLLEMGAPVDAVSFTHDLNTALGITATKKNLEIFALLLEHNASTSCNAENMDLREWCALHWRDGYRLLKEKIGPAAVEITVGDMVHIANQGTHSLHVYEHRHPGWMTKHQLEQTFHHSIRLAYPMAIVALLQYGVSPDCHTLAERPLRTALDSPKAYDICCLLIGFKATVDLPGILCKVAQKGNLDLLQLFVNSGVNLQVQGPQALVESVKVGHITSVAFLLESGVSVNALGLEQTPLQAAAERGDLETVELLLSYGADINAPAYPMGGCTAMQEALENVEGLEMFELLLENGADIFAPPALLDGVTALEAVSHHRESEANAIELCNRLLDLGAPVNRPNGEPSWVLHHAIVNGWDDILARLLEPRRNAVIDYMWRDPNELGGTPRTPTQLAAEYGKLKYVKMLLERGADINEAPACAYGQTALQAAACKGDLELVGFLLGKGADIHAKPAVEGGITALQGAAASGNVMLAKLLLDKGADVNAAPSFSEGRYAIEGAAEHGRLDMVQLLLNAGSKGNVSRKTGLRDAIYLAKENGHFAISALLESNDQRQGTIRAMR